MLTAIRSKSGSWIFKVLFGLLIVAFAIWGIGDIFRSDHTLRPVAEIGKNIEYSQAEFRRDLKMTLDRLAREQGVQLTPAEFQRVGGADQVIEQAVNAALFRAFADRQSLKISQDTAIAEVQRDPSFQDSQGRFDRARFEAALRQLGESEGGYVARLRDSLVSRAIYRAAIGGAIAPTPLAEQVYLFQTETRTVDAVTIPLDSITDIADPDDAALAKFHDDNADTYKAPEYRDATVIHLAPADFAGNVTVTDDEIAQEYTARQAEFGTPASREVEQVVVQDKAVAEKIRAAVSGGTPFADAVKAETGGDPVGLGSVTQDKLPPEIAEAVFALPAGGVSAALTSPFGIHVAHVISVQVATTKSLADVKDEIKQSIALARAGDELGSIVNQLDDTLAGGASLAEAGEKIAVKAQHFPAVDKNGLDPDDKPSGLEPATLAVIFATDTGNKSPVTPLADGSFVVASVDGITEPAVKPLEKVKDQVKADWLSDQRHKAADAKAKDMVEKLKGGAKLDALAAELTLTPVSSLPFTRDAGDPTNGVSPALAGEIFKLKVGEAATGPADDGPVVAVLTAIAPADKDAHKDDIAKLHEVLSSHLQADLTGQFIAALRGEIGVKIDREVVDSLLRE